MCGGWKCKSTEIKLSVVRFFSPVHLNDALPTVLIPQRSLRSTPQTGSDSASVTSFPSRGVDGAVQDGANKSCYNHTKNR